MEIIQNDGFNYNDIQLITNILTNKTYSLFSNDRVTKITTTIYTATNDAKRATGLLKLIYILTFFKFNSLMATVSITQMNEYIEKFLVPPQGYKYFSIFDEVVPKIMDRFTNEIINGEFNKREIDQRVKLFIDISIKIPYTEIISKITQLLREIPTTKEEIIQIIRSCGNEHTPGRDSTESIFLKTVKIVKQLIYIIILNYMSDIFEFEFELSTFKVDLLLFPIKRKAERDIFDLSNLIITGTELRINFGLYIGAFLGSCFGSFNLTRHLDIFGKYAGSIPLTEGLLSRFLFYISLKSPFIWKILKKKAPTFEPIVLKYRYETLKKRWELEESNHIRTNHGNDFSKWIYEQYWAKTNFQSFSVVYKRLIDDLARLRFYSDDMKSKFGQFAKYRREVFSTFFLVVTEKKIKDIIKTLCDEAISRILGNKIPSIDAIRRTFNGRLVTVEIPRNIEDKLQEIQDAFFGQLDRIWTKNRPRCVAIISYALVGRKLMVDNPFQGKSFFHQIGDLFKSHKKNIDFTLSQYDLHILFQKVINIYFTTGKRFRGKATHGAQNSTSFKDINKLINSTMEFVETTKIGQKTKTFHLLNLIMQASNVFMCPFFASFILNERYLTSKLSNKFDSIFKEDRFVRAWIMLQELHGNNPKNVFDELFNNNFFCDMNNLDDVIAGVVKLCYNAVYDNPIKSEHISEITSTYNEFKYKRPILDWFVDKCLYIHMKNVSTIGNENLEILNWNVNRYRCRGTTDDDGEEDEDKGPLPNHSEMTALAQFRLKGITIKSMQQMSHVFYDYSSFVLSNKLQQQSDFDDINNIVFQSDSLTYNVKEFGLYRASEQNIIRGAILEIAETVYKYISSFGKIDPIGKERAIKKTLKWVSNELIKEVMPLEYTALKIRISKIKDLYPRTKKKTSLLNKEAREIFSNTYTKTIIRNLDIIFTALIRIIHPPNPQKFRLDDAPMKFSGLFKILFGNNQAFKDKYAIFYLTNKIPFDYSPKQHRDSELLFQLFAKNQGNERLFANIIAGNDEKRYTIIHAYTYLKAGGYSLSAPSNDILHNSYKNIVFERILGTNLKSFLYTPQNKRAIPRVGVIEQFYSPHIQTY